MRKVQQRPRQVECRLADIVDSAVRRFNTERRSEVLYQGSVRPHVVSQSCLATTPAEEPMPTKLAQMVRVNYERSKQGPRGRLDDVCRSTEPSKTLRASV